MATCTRTDAHPLSECAARQPEPVPGQYAELEFTFHYPAGVEHVRAVVLITSVEERGDYAYVTWTNAAPGGGWHPRIGQFGAFRWGEQAYPTTRVLEVLPLRRVPASESHPRPGYRDEPVAGGGHDEYDHLRESAGEAHRG